VEVITSGIIAAFAFRILRREIHYNNYEAYKLLAQARVGYVMVLITTQMIWRVVHCKSDGVDPDWTCSQSGLVALISVSVLWVVAEIYWIFVLCRIYDRAKNGAFGVFGVVEDLYKAQRIPAMEANLENAMSGAVLQASGVNVSIPWQTLSTMSIELGVLIPDVIDLWL
jgi:hypothetical protein